MMEFFGHFGSVWRQLKLKNVVSLLLLAILGMEDWFLQILCSIIVGGILLVVVERCSILPSSQRTKLFFYPSQLTPNGMVQIAAFDTPDGLYDCAWSEVGFLHLHLLNFIKFKDPSLVIILPFRCEPHLYQWQKLALYCNLNAGILFMESVY
jgi:hypothetical protein